MKAEKPPFIISEKDYAFTTIKGDWKLAEKEASNTIYLVKGSTAVAHTYKDMGDYATDISSELWIECGVSREEANDLADLIVKHLPPIYEEARLGGDVTSFASWSLLDGHLFHADEWAMSVAISIAEYETETEGNSKKRKAMDIVKENLGYSKLSPWQRKKFLHLIREAVKDRGNYATLHI